MTELTIIDHTDGLVTDPGFYRMPERVYHSDPAPRPSLSASLAKCLIDETPYAAKEKHPRLNGRGHVEVPMHSRVGIGSLVHEYLTGHGDKIMRCEKDGVSWDNFTTKAARERRDEIIAMGRVPVLEKHLEAAIGCEAAIRNFFEDHPDLHWVFKEGQGEMTLVWADRLGLWGRARLDWWGGATRPFDVIDIKTTTAGLDDRSLQRLILDNHYHLQRAWYARGLSHLWPQLGGRIRYRIVFAEQTEPYGVRVVTLGQTFAGIGEEEAMTAAGIFRACQQEGSWPAYPHEVSTIEAPQWAAPQWDDRQANDVIFRTYATAIQLARSFQAPAIAKEAANG